MKYYSTKLLYHNRKGISIIRNHNSLFIFKCFEEGPGPYADAKSRIA